MVDPKLEEIRTRWAAATPGPWTGNVEPVWHSGVEEGDTPGQNDECRVITVLGGADTRQSVLTGDVEYDLYTVNGARRNLDAIIAAPTDIAYLLKQAEEFAAVKERARVQIRNNNSQIEHQLTYPAFDLESDRIALHAQSRLIAEIAGLADEPITDAFGGSRG